MKRTFILALAVFCAAGSTSAQTCRTENFSGSGNGWVLSQGARVEDYNNPTANCGNDRGIITPGVGGNNPSNIRTPMATSIGPTSIQVYFNMYVFNANLKCDSWKDFDCPTSVDVFYMIGGTKHNALIDFVLPPNGPSGTTLVNFNLPVNNLLPAGTEYAIQIEFKPKSGTGQCIQQNTKYILDNMRICEIRQNTFANPGNTDAKAADFTVISDNTNDLLEIKIHADVVYDRILVIDRSGKIMQTLTANTSGTYRFASIAKGNYSIRLLNGDSVVSTIQKPLEVK